MSAHHHRMLETVHGSRIRARALAAKRMRAQADHRAFDLIGSMVDATADTGVDRADLWEMATNTVMAVVAEHLMRRGCYR